MTFHNLMMTPMTLGEDVLNFDDPDDLGEGFVMTLVTTHYYLVMTLHDYTDDPCDNSDDF